MRKGISLASIIALGLVLVTGCKDEPTPDQSSSNRSGTTAPKTSRDAKASTTGENIDATEKEAAAKLVPAEDPIQDEIHSFRLATLEAFNSRDFDALEKTATELRATKALFGNGSWKIAQFYDAMDCLSGQLESTWQAHDQIYKEWIAAKPDSITAHVAYARFLTSYAWYARGDGYADSVTEEGFKLFRERLANARKTLESARGLPEKDPVWWLAAMTVALGEGWPRPEYDVLVSEATAFEPTFWGYDTARAYSLLPRWYGEAGDWEAYAATAAQREGGLGAEAYARIVIRLRGFYESIFRETDASWKVTRDGLDLLREKYPDSVEILSHSAMLATIAQDRPVAKAMFEKLNGRFLPGVWRNAERFVHYRNWAETGRW